MRFFVSTVSCVALLSAQFAPLVHAHSDVVEPSSIAVRPHFHLHGHDDHHHASAHDAMDDRHHSATEQNGGSVRHEHDNDAVYVVVFAGSTVSESRSGIDTASGTYGPITECRLFASIELPP